MNDNKKRIRTIIIVVVVLLIGIIGFSVYKIIERNMRSATLEIAVAPLAATLTLNGEKYTNGTYQMFPGTYEVSLTADGFEPLSETIELSAGTTTQLYRYLTGPDGDMSFYYNGSEEEQMNLMYTTNYDAGVMADAYAAIDPVLKITPYYDEERNHFTIYANVGENNVVTIKVNLNTCTDLLKDDYIKEANQYLESNNIDLSKYTIDYVGLCDDI